jgi:dienelactone hydrolase
MLDFYAALRRSSTKATAVYLLRYRVRGWNAGPAGPDPVVDARWALDQVESRHPGATVALLGHSMGGRTAFAVAGDPRVVGVCGLAPWLPGGEPLPPPGSRARYAIAHGTADRMTSAAGSLQYAARLRRAGAAVARFELPEGKHALLDEVSLWRRFAVQTTLGLVGDRPLPDAVAGQLGETGAGGLATDLRTTFA